MQRPSTAEFAHLVLSQLPRINSLSGTSTPRPPSEKCDAVQACSLPPDVSSRTRAFTATPSLTSHARTSARQPLLASAATKSAAPGACSPRRDVRMRCCAPRSASQWDRNDPQRCSSPSDEYCPLRSHFDAAGSEPVRDGAWYSRRAHNSCPRSANSSLPSMQLR